MEEDIKHCGYCGRQLVRHYKESPSRWKKRKYCNRKCGGRATAYGADATGDYEAENLTDTEIWNRRIQNNIRRAGKGELVQ